MGELDASHIAEGVERHKHRLDDLYRAQENERHAHSLGGGRSLRWLWIAAFFIVVVALLMLILYTATPPGPPLPE